jgi:hypothetical protein
VQAVLYRRPVQRWLLEFQRGQEKYNRRAKTTFAIRRALDGRGIGRITPTGVITEFPVPTLGSVVGVITAGPDGNLWFLETIAIIGRARVKASIVPQTLAATAHPFMRALSSNSGGEHDRAALENIFASVFNRSERRPITQLKGSSGLFEICVGKVVQMEAIASGAVEEGTLNQFDRLCSWVDSIGRRLLLVPQSRLWPDDRR